MATFDLRGLRIAKYTPGNDSVTYSDWCEVGEEMTVNLELRSAEGRLYARSSLSEYLRKITGGSISIGTKDISDDAQKIMFGAAVNSIEVTPSGGSKASVTEIEYGGDMDGSEVGLAFYAPDKINGVTKYTAVFVSRASFGPPSRTYQTQGDNITFQTPTTTGEFLKDHSAGRVLVKFATCDTEALAIAWCKLKLGESA